MDLDELLSHHCVEYPQGTPALDNEVVQSYLALVPRWTLEDEGHTLRFSRQMRDFRDAIEVVSQVAELAEEEQHHPDIRLYSYRKLQLDLSTHSVGGLTENDFIMAARISRLLKDRA